MVQCRPFIDQAPNALTKNLLPPQNKKPVGLKSDGLQFPDQDSNLEKRHQKPVCYHYTIGE